MASDANLEFKIKADSSQATGEVAKFRSKVGSDLNVIQGNFGSAGKAIQKEMGDVAQSLAANTGALGRFASALGPAGLAAAAMGGAAIAAGAAVFGLAKSAADAGSKFHDLSIQTGLSVETLSGLDLQLKQSGTDVDAFARAAVLMQRNLGEAAGGSKELQKAFAALGVKDARAGLADMDGTIRTVSRSLGEMGSAGERNAAGSKVMGRGFKELSVFLSDTGGKLDEVIEASRKAGRVMTDDAANAADAFGDQLDALSNAATIAGRTVGLEALPQITGAMRDLTGATEGNISVLRSWGKQLASVIQFARIAAESIAAFSIFDTNISYQAKVKAIADRVARGDEIAAGKRFDLNAPITPEQQAAGAAERARALGAIGVRPSEGGDFFSPPAKAKREKDRKDELDKLKAFAKEWEFVVTSTTGGKHNAGSLHGLGRAADVSVRGKSDAEIRAFMDAARQAGYGVRDERTRPAGQKVWGGPHIHLETQSKAVRAAVEAETKTFDAQEKTLERLVRAISEADLEMKGLTRSTAEQQIAVEYERLGIGQLTGEAQELGEALFAVRAQQIAGNAEAKEYADTLLGFADRMGTMSELLRNIPLEPNTPFSALERTPVDVPTPENMSMWEEFKNTAKEALETVSSSAATSKELIGGLFSGMTQGITSAIQGWLLYGGSIGKAMKQATAAVLAGIAAQAAIKAIFQLAEGFAALFFNPAEAAAHFKAAALYGAAAVAAGVGARAFAGSSFASAGAASGGSGAFGGGTPLEGDREDFRTRYQREQEEKDRYTRREDRRSEAPTVVQLYMDSKMVGHAILDRVRDGGDLQTGWQRAMRATP